MLMIGDLWGGSSGSSMNGNDKQCLGVPPVGPVCPWAYYELTEAGL